MNEENKEETGYLFFTRIDTELEKTVSDIEDYGFKVIKEDGNKQYAILSFGILYKELNSFFLFSNCFLSCLS